LVRSGSALDFPEAGCPPGHAARELTDDTEAMKPMTRREKHIALVSLGQFDPFLRYGASRSLLARLQFLKEQGNNVSIISFLTNDPHPRFLFDDALADPAGPIARENLTCRALFRGLDFYQEILPYSRDQFIREYGSVIKAIVRRIEREDLDCVFTADQDHFPLLAAWLLRIPGAHFFNSLSNVQRFARATDYVHFLKRRTIFASSQFLRAQIHALWGLDAVVWYPFIDFDAYPCRQGRNQIDRIGFSASSGGLAKGSEIVTAISERLPERLFVVVGEDHSKRSGAVADNLTYWGHVPDMNEFYAQINLLLVPSLSEDSFPRVILEAAANGIPVIANRVGGIPEALGDSGVLIDWDPGRSPAITHIADKYVSEIRRVLDDDELYRHHSRKALARAEAYRLEQTRLAHQIYDEHIR